MSHLAIVDHLAPSIEGFRRSQRLAPLGYFAMGLEVLTVHAGPKMTPKRALVIANGSDWSPQPITLHFCRDGGDFENEPSWFSDDFDYHMGVAVGDVTGSGYDDVVVAVYAGKNQDLAQGGIKIYLGGPNGLDPHPMWLSRGFAATGVALGDLTGSGRLDIAVSCLFEEGSIQEPKIGAEGLFEGRGRILINQGNDESRRPCMRTLIVKNEEARGAGDVSIADVDDDGNLDLVFAAQRTTVLYGPFRTSSGAFVSSGTWRSLELHPFSFSAQAFLHPNYPGSLLVASSRGLLSSKQLKKMSLEDVGTGVFIHRPRREAQSYAVQKLCAFDSKRPEIPAGLTVVHDLGGYPSLFVGFLDARGSDIRGACLRRVRAEKTEIAPFASGDGESLHGGGVMAARVISLSHVHSPTCVRTTHIELREEARRVVSLSRFPLGDILRISLSSLSGTALAVPPFTQTSDGGALCFGELLPPGTQLVVDELVHHEFDIAATSSAAWPPAGASGIWRGLPENRDSVGEGAPSGARWRVNV